MDQQNRKFKMYLILTASNDTYITNKIIDNKFRATDANTGRAGTIDLFKLYAESISGSDSTPIELSRALIKFNLSKLHELTASSLNVNASNFQAHLKLYDILGGQATPANFKLVIFPLSQSFDEGIGRDVASFQDIDRANWITASYSSDTNNEWYITGSGAGGLMGSTDIDYISSGNLGSGVSDFGVVQQFPKGNEDLFVNVTTLISASLAGQISNHGFRISFSGSEETDEKTRFVKRFASRHSSNPFKVPQLHVSWDDSLVDHHNDFIFDVTGSLFLNNYQRGRPANILSGAAASSISGDDCILVKLQKDQYTKYITGSQHKTGTGQSGVTGLYSASFAVSTSDSTKVNTNEKLINLLRVSGSVTFDEYWTSVDGSVGYYTGSLEVKPPQRTSYDVQPSDLLFHFVNLKTEYSLSDVVKFRVFIDDINPDAKAYKIPYSKKSLVLTNVYYQVRKAGTKTIVVPFKKDNSGTLLSCDSDGMFFDFRMVSLPAGHTYEFDLLVEDYNMSKIFEGISGRFKVES